MNKPHFKYLLYKSITLISDETERLVDKDTDDYCYHKLPDPVFITIPMHISTSLFLIDIG